MDIGPHWLLYDAGSSIGPYSRLPRSFLAYPAVLSGMAWWSVYSAREVEMLTWGIDMA